MDRAGGVDEPVGCGDFVPGCGDATFVAMRSAFRPVVVIRGSRASACPSRACCRAIGSYMAAAQRMESVRQAAERDRAGVVPVLLQPVPGNAEERGAGGGDHRGEQDGEDQGGRLRPGPS